MYPLRSQYATNAQMCCPRSLPLMPLCPGRLWPHLPPHPCLRGPHPNHAPFIATKPQLRNLPFASVSASPSVFPINPSQHE